MKRVYTVAFLLALIISVGYSQKASWQNLPNGFMDNPPIKPVYICLQINADAVEFDYENDDFDTFWALTPKEYSDFGIISGESDGPGDNDIRMKAAWDEDFLYIAMKVTDDFILDPASGAELLDEFEIYWATYPDYWHPLGDTATTHLDKVVAHTRFPHLGGYKTGDWALANFSTAVYDDYTVSWELDPWGPSATPWAVNWGTGAEALLLDARYEKVDANNFNFMAIIPWYEAVADFIPRADTALSIEVKYNDEDPDQDPKCSKSFAGLSNDAYWTTYYSGVFNLLAEEDLVLPVLSNVTPLAVTSAEDVFVSFTVSEDAMVYMVPLATAADEASIIAAAGNLKVAAVMGDNSMGIHCSAGGDNVLYAIDYSGNISVVSPTIVTAADVVAPVLSDVLDPVEIRDNSTFISDESAMVYLVPAGTAADEASIIAAALGEVAASVGATAKINTNGIVTIGNSYELFAIDCLGNISAAGTFTVIDDITPPVLNRVFATRESGVDVRLRSNEDGWAYMVPEGTVADSASITTAAVGEVETAINKDKFISSVGLDVAPYWLFAIDLSGNISDTAFCEITPDVTAPVVTLANDTVQVGSDVVVSLNEAGMAYLVPAGTVADSASITADAVGEAAVDVGAAGDISTVGLDATNYELYAIDLVGNISDTAYVWLTVNDETAPILSDVTTPVDTKTETELSATSDEDAMLYLVPDGTASDKASIVAAAVVEAAATADTPVVMDISGVDLGNYDLYAIDAVDNISVATAVEIMSSVGISEDRASQFGIYPNPVADVLHVMNAESIQKIEIANILGQNVKVFSVVNDNHDVSDLDAGLYFVRMYLDGEVIVKSMVKK